MEIDATQIGAGVGAGLVGAIPFFRMLASKSRRVDAFFSGKDRRIALGQLVNCEHTRDSMDQLQKIVKDLAESTANIAKTAETMAAQINTMYSAHMQEADRSRIETLAREMAEKMLAERLEKHPNHQPIA